MSARLVAVLVLVAALVLVLAGCALDRPLSASARQAMSDHWWLHHEIQVLKRELDLHKRDGMTRAKAQGKRLMISTEERRPDHVRARAQERRTHLQ